MVMRRRGGKRTALVVWMNGERVGVWSRTTADVEVFEYDETWLQSPRTRPLSLTMPFLPGNESHRGDRVAAWFENLLPDNVDIRRRIATRFSVKNDTRSLLAEIGRDCVGAVQMLLPDEVPAQTSALDAHPMTEADVARVLRGVTSSSPFGLDQTTNENFRISVAGAQEKTALLQKNGQWYHPRGSTPSTHILKLPLGLVGGTRYDLQHSIENEWLCLQLLNVMGFNVARAHMASFEDDVSTEHALVVERFDRQWTRDAQAIVRLPQEDLCQATGTPPDRKYENEGGPGIRTILPLLRAGNSPKQDVRTFVLAQLAFWLLAAIDGHAKNFSFFLLRDGYILTPMYDVISAWPFIGHQANKLPIQRAKLAMAIRCKNAHYEMHRISVRHWKCLCDESGVSFSEMKALVETVPTAIANVASGVPSGFPETVWEAITSGLLSQAERFQKAVQATE